MDLRQTDEYGRYMTSQGWLVKNFQFSFSNFQLFIKKIPLLPFSIMKMQRWEGDLNIDKLAEIRKKYRVIYSVLEPGANFQGSILNFQLNNSPYLPTKTIVVDLAKSENQLLAEMSKDSRQRIKNLESRIKILESDKTADIQKFREEWKRQKKGYVPSLKSLKNLKRAFGKKCWILTAESNSVRPSTPKNLVAGTVILLSDDTAYYYYAWTNEKGRELGAQYGLIWEAMRRAKKLDLKKFDFEGIFDGRWPLNRWKGFTAFKKKFGGDELTYPGSYQRWL